MNILVLNGSPRLKGYTSKLVEKFTQGAQSVGHKVDILQVGTMKINSCIGCEYCYSHDSCAFKDDMQKVYNAFQQAEMIVFASPVYYWGLTPFLQATISRIYAIDKPQKAQKYAIILTSHSPSVYDAIVSQYNSIVSFFGAKSVGVLTAYGSQREDKNKLEEAFDFGKNL